MSGGPARVVDMSNFDASRMLSFDLETTSVNPREARIVTSAMVRIDGREVDPVELLADPGIEIPPETTAIHGISTEYAREHGRPHDEVLAESIQRIRAGWRDGLTLIVFNASYDLTILRSQSPEFTVDGLVYDPFVIDKLKDKYRKGKRTLTDLCAHYSVRLDTAHEATSDALAAARIAWKQIKMWPELAAMSAEELMEFQAVGYYEMQTDFKKYLEGRGRDTTTVNTSWPMQG
ncbi:DNA polymerase III subunit epsilon [Corynebacterium occultum]|uniref:DNA polymerase III subunit epsilon n=2 Tax=Corynebacterium occultum TaxID=2675219 RepID=A0A6B8WAU5_9CORY|nr:DNA polymerase III subunit epsilon [Corynebacterium occultum]